MPRQSNDASTLTTRERPYRTRMRAAWSRLRKDQQGAGTVELVVATPLLLLLVLLIAQFALYMHATHIAQSAASEALSAARVAGGSAAAGNAEGQRILTQMGSGPLQGGSVTTQRGSTQASVLITGTATSVIPFMTLTVQSEAIGPIEKFTPPTDAGAGP